MRIFLFVLLSLFQSFFPKSKNEEKIPGQKAWDKCMFTNAAGQSGNPASPFYRNLYLHWANDQYQPLVYTFDAIKKITVQQEIFQPLQ
jgi:acyl-homoserine lactone acylase PvdQ